MKKTSAHDLRDVHSCDCPACRQHPDGAVAREHQAINRLVAVTDEQSRRLILGFLAHKEGRGAVARLARITGLDRNTIARGRRELLQSDLAPPGRVRRLGAGRKCVEAQAPGC
jgi:hypothetical protein